MPDGARIGQPASSAADNLHRKLSWLTLFRLATITVLLGGTALTDFPWSGALAEGPGPLYGLVLLTYLASLGFALALRTRWRPTVVALLQVATDVGVATAVVGITGGSSSIFVFLYLIAIVNGSVLLFRNGAFVGAALSLLAYLPLVWAQERLRGHGLIPFVHAGAFVATAALAGYLAEQLQRTGERLAAREGDLAAITALHEAIVQSVASGLVTIDRAGVVTFLNRAGEQMIGLSAGEIRGQLADRWFSAFQPGSARDETDLVNASGARLRVGYTISPLVGRDGTPLGRAVIFQDLTHLREMEAQVQRSERLADLGRLAAGLAHELRNPLASMAGSLELLRGSARRDEDARLMAIVLREAGRLDQLVTRFLAFTRPEPLRRADVALHELVAEALDVFRHDPAAARVRIVRDLAPAPAWCDADQLRQVLWNLLVNAAQAAGARDAGGTVTVRCEPALGGGARLGVEDDGPGIAPADLSQVFTPFFTTKPTGTGLGLAVVQRIVDAHGGQVGVESPPEGGARFVVVLPPRPAVAAALG